jgi:predicted transcriptional regulator of viral defense system
MLITLRRHRRGDPGISDDSAMTEMESLRHHLIYVEDVRAAGGDPRELQRASRRGLMTRVRRGVYIPAARWHALNDRDRHLLTILAVTHRCHPPFLVAGGSAGAAWGLPFAAGWPSDVTLLIPVAAGGKSEPGVRRTVASAVGATEGVIDGIPVTGLARTALDMARTESFPRAVAIIDHALSYRNPHFVSHSDLFDELARAGYARRGAHLERVVTFASPLSDSPYESLARAMIHELGFEAPILQHEFGDDEGVIRPDFLWPGIAAGEFDGRVKYADPEYSGGDPAGVLWREKKREDRLRRFVPTVVRIVADDLHDRSRLARLLDGAGVPRVERPRSVSTDPGGMGAIAPEREQWPRWQDA